MTIDLDCSLVLVTFRSSAEAAVAVASFRREAERAGLRAEVVVVDHSEDEAERARLEALSPDRLVVRPNRGYAAGVNAGLEVARAPRLLIGNPDLELTSGSVGRLVGALDETGGIVGPTFGVGSFVFPPADVQSPRAELRRWLAGGGRTAWSLFVRRELRRWQRLWAANEPLPVPTLSGALLAASRPVVDRVGPWDEGYFLYFEETDWLLRARRDGLVCWQLPDVVIEHRWGHATGTSSEPDFAAARARFYARHHGRLGRLVSGLGAGAYTPPAERWPPPAARLATSGNHLWLASPSRCGFPAALFRGAPEALSEALAELAADERHGRELTVMEVEAGRGRVRGVWRRPGSTASGDQR